MKIDRRKFLAASSSALVLAKSQLSSAARVPRSETSENLAIAERIEGREVKVYTTDDNSNHRLAATDTLVFKHLGQPLETQICVFVDPAKTFQTILGIGGALTDASAETFAKLPGALKVSVRSRESYRSSLSKRLLRLPTCSTKRWKARRGSPNRAGSSSPRATKPFTPIYSVSCRSVWARPSMRSQVATSPCSRTRVW